MGITFTATIFGVDQSRNVSEEYICCLRRDDNLE